MADNSREIDREAESRFQELDKQYRLKNPVPRASQKFRFGKRKRLLTVEQSGDEREKCFS
jgi:hypothetical protein